VSLTTENTIVGQLQGARGGDREAMRRLLESCRDYLRIVAEKEIDVSSGRAAGVPLPCVTELRPAHEPGI
jgi:hypothetical protein